MVGIMKIPEIYGNNKIRDFKICQKYMEGERMEDIAVTFNLSLTRVKQIIYRNRGVLSADITYEKAKRINWLQRQIKKSEETKKDTADLLEQLRKEIEGDKPVFEQHTHFVYEWKTNTDRLSTTNLPSGDPQR